MLVLAARCFLRRLLLLSPRAGVGVLRRGRAGWCVKLPQRTMMITEGKRSRVCMRSSAPARFPWRRDYE